VVAEERDQVGEGLDTTEFGRANEAHENVAHVGAVLCLEGSLFILNFSQWV
jgi:hypothetical protein